MLLELSAAVACALLGNALFKKLGAPGLLGMLLCGVLLGPSVLHLLGTESRQLLREFKTVALIVILLRAGLGIKKDTLQLIGPPAIRMGFVPGAVEGTGVMLASHWLLDLSWYPAGMLGFIVAAVSPAVVVPQMLELKDQGYGKQREVPTLVLAGASLDDVFAITAFGMFAGLAAGGETKWFGLVVGVPGGILLGGLIGVLLGLGLVKVFGRFHMRDTFKVIAITLASVVFQQVTELEPVRQQIQIAALLGIMAIGFVLLEKNSVLAGRLAKKFNKVWVLAELLLFLSIGAEVQLEQLDSSLLGSGLTVLGLGLVVRCAGVALALQGSSLLRAERVFCMISYLPKATVQAAMGAIPLALIAEGKLGETTIAEGQTILAIAVLSIVVTAPLGAIAIRRSAPKLLIHTSQS